MPGAIVIDAGPRIGTSVARRLAHEGLPVAVLARSLATLEGAYNTALIQWDPFGELARPSGVHVRSRPGGPDHSLNAAVDVDAAGADSHGGRRRRRTPGIEEGREAGDIAAGRRSTPQALAANGRVQRSRRHTPSTQPALPDTAAERR
jgi:hypothetical protein